MQRLSPNTPFAPAKIRPFYGWIIVFVGVVGIVMSMPGQTVGVSAFTEHLLQAFNLTRNQFSFAYMLGTILSSLFLTKAARRNFNFILSAIQPPTALPKIEIMEAGRKIKKARSFAIPAFSKTEAT